MKKKATKKATTEADAPVVKPGPLIPSTESRKPDYEWSGKPVFRCHRSNVCRFERVDDLPAVLRHEARHQPTVPSTAKKKSAKEKSE